MIDPTPYPWLSHWYEFTPANYDMATKSFANLAALSRHRADDYRPVYDDGANGDPVFATVGTTECLSLNDNAYLACRSMLLGEMTFFAVVEHTVASGAQNIALMGAGAATAEERNWAMHFRNGQCRNRVSNGAANGASIGGAAGLQLVVGAADADARRLSVALNGGAVTQGAQLNRPGYYAQTCPELWIGDAFWTGLNSRFVGRIAAIYAGPVNLASDHPAALAALTAEISATYGISLAT